MYNLGVLFSVHTIQSLPAIDVPTIPANMAKYLEAHVPNSVRHLPMASRCILEEWKDVSGSGNKRGVQR